jgi:hypothetical protein
MPDNNNRYVKNDLQIALQPAELRIAQFKPPAAGADPPANVPDPNYRVNISEIQTQVAQQAALERTNALFDFLVNLITQGSADEINRQQIIQRISGLEERIRTIEAILARNSLV